MPFASLPMLEHTFINIPGNEKEHFRVHFPDSNGSENFSF